MNRRILIVDDNPAIHQDFRKILSPRAEEADLSALSAELFGDSTTSGVEYHIDSAHQGQEGLALVQQAFKSGQPYAMAFVDVRMPPGWDGIETIARLWQADPDLQVVVCTAYSDHSWQEISARLGGSDNLLILKKPFDVIEVLQLSHALTRKWDLAQESKRHLLGLESTVHQRTLELMESESRYRSLFEHMLEGFAYIRLLFEGDQAVDFEYLEVNKAFTTLTGLKDVVGKKFSEVFPNGPVAHPELLQHYSYAARTGRPQKFEIYLDELKAWFAVSAFTPAAECIIAVFDNITVRKQVELRAAAYASLDHRLATAKTAREAAQAITDVADQLIGWDAAVCNLYSSTEKILTQVLQVDLVNGQRKDCENPHSKFLPPSPLALKVIEEGGQLILRGNDDEAFAPTTVPFGDLSRPSASILYVPIRNGSSVIGVLSIQSYRPNAYDLKELEILQTLADRCAGALERIRAEESLRQTQEQLRHSQKLEGIGQLAGGVAHDFNNLLAVVRGNAELALMDESRLDPEAAGCLKQVIAAAERAANLTRQLLAFSRKQVMQSRALNLNDVIANITKMLKRLIGETIELRCSYAEGLPFLRADIGMLEQVLVNLVVNARDAMPRGGCIQLSTQLVRLDAAYTFSHPDSRAGEFVCCTVQDNGSGIAPEHLPHIFEPFFTTKDHGKGTGLGLSTVYGIVKQHLGWVEVESQLGTGSAFKIFLPAMKPSESSATVASAPGSSRDGGNESILLVEDEEAVRSVTRRFLALKGYAVTEAASGPAAMVLWHNRGKDFDLLITDLVMPEGISGTDLARRLRQDAPDLKVVFTSGYSTSLAGKEADLLTNGSNRFLQKPCPPGELLRTVRELLDQPSPHRQIADACRTNGAGVVVAD